MRTADSLHFAWQAITSARGRSLLMLLAMSIGVASVVVLTALGEGARRYVVGEFQQLGTDLLFMLPGRNETTGGPPPLFGLTPRDLTLDDAEALLRSPAIVRIGPISVGQAPVSHGALERDVTILGSNRDFFIARQIHVQQGRMLPEMPVEQQRAVTVLGHKLKKALFGHRNALGEWVRIGDQRYQVIGVLTPEGISLGTDLGDVAIIPVASAQNLFNNPSLFRVLMQARSKADLDKAREDALAIIARRHGGKADVTVITQDAVLSTFDQILSALTLTVAGIATISLLVAGILIMNVMLVTVSRRVPEIGLLKALGAARGQVLQLFLLEAVLMAAAGSLLGLALAGLALTLAGLLYPNLPLIPPWWAIPAATGTALLTGALFGILPARRAANLDPVQALTGR